MPQPSVLNVTDLAKASLLAYNEKNFDKLRNILTPNVVYNEYATGRTARGFDDVLSIWRGWAKAIPDSVATFLKEYVSGTTVIFEMEWNGTHTAPLQTPTGEVAPTGKKIKLRACQIIETRDDKVMSINHYFDMATLLNQLGVLPK